MTQTKSGVRVDSVFILIQLQQKHRLGIIPNSTLSISDDIHDIQTKLSLKVIMFDVFLPGVGSVTATDPATPGHEYSGRAWKP